MSQIKSVNFAGQQVCPSKIVCVGRNYVDHIKELNNEIPTEPVIFIKPNSAIGISLNSVTDEDIHFESELAFMIKNGRIVGVAFGLDLTKRELQNRLKEKRLPWERAKAFDGAALFSDFIPIGPNLSELSLTLYIDNKPQQSAGVNLMINKPEALVANIQEFCTLVDYDIVMTGTPAGVGRIEKGQVFDTKVFHGNKCLIERSWTAV